MIVTCSTSCAAPRTTGPRSASLRAQSDTDLEALADLRLVDELSRYPDR